MDTVPLTSPTTPVTPAAKPAPKTVSTIKAKLARLEARKVALETTLADRDRFSKWHGKTAARALARSLGFRSLASPEVLRSLGLSPLSPPEAARLAEILAAFAVSPWAP